MPGDWEKSVHPDLIEEEAPASEPAAPSPPRRGGRTSPPAADSQSTPPPAERSEQPDSAARESEPVSTDTETEAAAEPPDWLAQVKDAKDADEILTLLAKNLPRDQFEKNQVVSGLIGQIGDRRAKELLAKQDNDRQQQAKLAAAANNDLYTLGELTQRELQQQIASQQAAQAAVPFMDGVTLFQKGLPETIQKEVSGQTFGAGKSHAEGVAEYISFIVDKAVELGVAKRESALRKSILSEVNGDEPVPERDSGTPGRVREVTDEQIAAMSLTEYEALFDENGRPKPGVRHRSTRGIPVRQH